MIKTIYVNWEEREVFSEKEFKEKLKQETNRLRDDDENFEEYLDKYFSTLDLWQLGLEEKIQILNDYKATCEKQARENLDWETEKFEIEV